MKACVRQTAWAALAAVLAATAPLGADTIHRIGGSAIENVNIESASATEIKYRRQDITTLQTLRAEQVERIVKRMM